MPRKAKDYIKDNIVETHLRTKHKIRVAQAAVDALNAGMNPVIEDVLKLAATNAKAARRKTVLARDIKDAITTRVARRDLEPVELIDHILRGSAADIAAIVKGLNAALKEYQGDK